MEGVKLPYAPNSWNLHPIDLKHSAMFIQIKGFKNAQKDLPIVRILTEKLFLGVHNDKYNVIQVLWSNYIDSNYLYSQKRLIFQKSSFVFSVTPYEKTECDRPHPGMIFWNTSDLCVPITYKIRPLKAQVLKSYRTFVIQKSYRGRAFLQNSQNRSTYLFKCFWFYLFIQIRIHRDTLKNRYSDRYFS